MSTPGLTSFTLVTRGQTKRASPTWLIKEVEHVQTIEVEIDPGGRIHPLEPLSFVPSGRAYLTLLPASDKRPTDESSSAAQALKLLASPRFVQRPAANPVEVQQRIGDLRNDWGSR